MRFIQLITLVLLATAVKNTARADELLFLNCYECANPGGAEYDGGPTSFHYLMSFDYLMVGNQDILPFPPTYIAGGSIQIQTGDLIGSGANTWDFGSGGSFTLTGGIGGNGASAPFLLSASILSAYFYGGGTSLGGGSLYLDISATVNEEALDLLGLPDTQYVGSFYAELTNVYGADGWFSPAVPPGPIFNGYNHDFQALLRPVPEPASFFLLSTAVVLLTLSFRARRSASLKHRQ